MNYSSLFVAAALFVALWATVAAPADARAQITEEQLREDIRTLRVAQFDPLLYADGSASETEAAQALQRILVNPDAFVALVDADITLPADDNLTAYAESVDVGYYSSLIEILLVIDTPPSRALLQDIYYETAPDADTLNARLLRKIEELGGGWREHEITRTLNYATGGASVLNGGALDALGYQGDNSLVDHAFDRYTKPINPSLQVTIEEYVLDVTGTFPPPGEGPLLPGAFVIASDTVQASFGDSTLVNGQAHDIDGAHQPNQLFTHGIFTTSEATRQAVLDGLAAAPGAVAIGIKPIEDADDPAPDVAQGALPFDRAALVDDALANVDTTLGRKVSGTVGTPDAPVVAHAPQGLGAEMSLTGAGVLLVENNLEMREGTLDWKGLVIVTEPLSTQQNSWPTEPLLEVSRVAMMSVTGGVLLIFEGVGSSVVAPRIASGRLRIRYSRAALELLEDLDLSLPPAPVQAP